VQDPPWLPLLLLLLQLLPLDDTLRRR